MEVYSVTDDELCKSVLDRILPKDPCVRIICLKVLLGGIVKANSISRAGWSAYLNGEVLCLNIGHTEAFILDSQKVRIYLLVDDGDDGGRPADSFLTESNNVNSPDHTKVFTALLPSQASAIAPYCVWLCKNFEKFAAAALPLTKAGKPRRTNYTHVHREGVITYLANALNEYVPTPVY